MHFHFRKKNSVISFLVSSSTCSSSLQSSCTSFLSHLDKYARFFTAENVEKWCIHAHKKSLMKMMKHTTNISIKSYKTKKQELKGNGKHEKLKVNLLSYISHMHKKNLHWLNKKWSNFGVKWVFLILKSFSLFKREKFKQARSTQLPFFLSSIFSLC